MVRNCKTFVWNVETFISHISIYVEPLNVLFISVTNNSNNSYLLAPWGNNCHGLHSSAAMPPSSVTMPTTSAALVSIDMVVHGTM